MHELVERPLAAVAERRVADVARETEGLAQRLVEAQHAGDAAGHLTHLERVAQACAVVIALVVEEDLGLLEPAERGRVGDAIAVPLEDRAVRVRRLLEAPAERVDALHRAGRELRGLAGLTDPRRQASVGSSWLGSSGGRGGRPPSRSHGRAPRGDTGSMELVFVRPRGSARPVGLPWRRARAGRRLPAATSVLHRSLLVRTGDAIRRPEEASAPRACGRGGSRGTGADRPRVGGSDGGAPIEPALPGATARASRYRLRHDERALVRGGLPQRLPRGRPPNLAAAREEVRWLVEDVLAGARGVVLDDCCGFGRHGVAMSGAVWTSWGSTCPSTSSRPPGPWRAPRSVSQGASARPT